MIVGVMLYVNIFSFESLCHSKGKPFVSGQNFFLNKHSESFSYSVHVPYRVHYSFVLLYESFKAYMYNCFRTITIKDEILYFNKRLKKP